MQDTQNQFIRKYIRKSRSKWAEQDDSTILLLANIDKSNGKNALNFEHYIYLHRDAVGRTLGISISKQLLKENPEFSGQYLESLEMYAFLLIYVDDIVEFCDLFADEFERVFMIPPRDFFKIAEIRWWSIIENN